MEYFGVNMYENPLLHMWSLSLEEQFYFFWPILVVVVSFFAPKAFALKILLFLTPILTLASFTTFILKNENF
jgi:peptidoglycan/LPS O-acetylase OafA/YrhL